MFVSPEHKNGIVQDEETNGHLNLLRVTRAAALLGAIASLALNTQPLSPTHPGESLNSDIAAAQTSAQSGASQDFRAVAARVKKHCTSLRRKPNDIYMGKGCSEDGDTFNVIGDIETVKGWSLGVMVVDGIYKCGFARAGVLPARPLRARASSHCRDFHPPLVEDAFSYFEDWNCSEKNPCRDGTYFSRLSDRCTNTSIYENYASDEPSPFNMYGTGDGGFSDKKKAAKTFVRYRVQVKPSSQAGKAIVVRGPKWGLMRDECVNQGKVRRGGTKAFKD